MLLSKGSVACGTFRAGARPRPRAVVVLARSAPSERKQTSFNIHGRHVTVTDEIEAYVLQKLRGTLQKLLGAEYLEAEGGIEEVDVRLMNTQAEVTLHPHHLNKQLHDTFLRQGELKALGMGDSLYSAFDEAAAQLEKKLHKWTSAPPMKKDYRKI